MRLSTILILTLASTTSLFAQPEMVNFNFYDCGNTSDRFQDIFECANGDYVACGDASTQEPGWIVRVNHDLEIVWSRNYANSHFFSIIECNNGDLLCGGTVEGGFGAILTHADGDPIWTHRFESGTCYAVLELKAGDFILTGYTQNPVAYVTRVTHGGDVVWATHVAVVGRNTRLFTMREVNEGILAAGDAQAQDAHDPNSLPMLLVKLSLDGEQRWVHLLNFVPADQRHPSTSICRSMISTPNGDGFILACYDGDQWNNRYKNAVGIMKIDNDGNERWENIINTNDAASWQSWGIARAAQNGAAIVGYRYANNRTYPFITRIDVDGGVLWQRLFEQEVQVAGMNGLMSVIQARDGSLLAAGTFLRDGEPQGNDGLILRIEPENPDPILNFSPRDTLLRVLQDDSIRFVVRARDQQGREMAYQWIYEDSVCSHDTTWEHCFDSLGVYDVTCKVFAEQSQSRVTWHITVVDLMIAGFIPDSLSLAVKRGHLVNFALDSVRATPGDSVSYDWTVTNLNNQEREDAGRDARSTIQFDHTGNFRIEGLAYRGEARDNVTWTVAVRSAILDYWPSRLTLTVPPDTIVHFEVIPFNADSGVVHYEWRFDQDLLGMDTSEVALNFGEVGDYQIGVVVRDSTGADTLVWRVRVMQPDATPPYPPLQARGESLTISPNPFNSVTTFRYSLARPSRVNLAVYNLTGERVAHLVNGFQSAGNYRCKFDGASLATGIYLYRIAVNDQTLTGRLLLIK